MKGFKLERSVIFQLQKENSLLFLLGEVPWVSAAKGIVKKKKNSLPVVRKKYFHSHVCLSLTRNSLYKLIEQRL